MSLFSGIKDLVPGLGNPFGLPSRGLWNLQVGSFTVGQPAGLGGSISNAISNLGASVGNLLGGPLSNSQQSVSFFVENNIGQMPGQTTALETVSDSGGRRLAVYEYPYIDGQMLVDLGRKGEKFSFNIKFFGDNYQTLFKSFIAVVTQSSQKGTLNHPVRGTFPARFLDWEYVHRHDEWNSVTIRATFLEDSTDSVTALNAFDSINSVLRNALQVLSSVSGAITQALSTIIAIKNIPGNVLHALNTSLQGITSTISSLLGVFAATYSVDAELQTLMANAVKVGNVLNTNSGTVTSSTSNPTGQLPPVFQVGFSPADQANIASQLSNFVDANQITPQQAMYTANQARSQIADAIAQVNTELGNDGYAVVLQYRILAVQIQTVTQAALASIQTQVTLFKVPYHMSLRMVAYINGLSIDAQNQIRGTQSVPSLCELRCEGFYPVGARFMSTKPISIVCKTASNPVKLKSTNQWLPRPVPTAITATDLQAGKASVVLFDSYSFERNLLSPAAPFRFTCSRLG